MFWSDAKIACFFCTSLEAQKKRKVGPRCGQVAPTDPRKVREGMVSGARCPRAATRATWYKILNHKSQDTKASWLRVQGTFEGSNTANGQRPGEFWTHLACNDTVSGSGWVQN